MTARDFCYWLQGYFEIHGNQPRPPEPESFRWLTGPQVEMIQKHLALVFKHEIDPSMGDANHQQVLNNAHNTKPNPPAKPDGIVRC